MIANGFILLWTFGELGCGLLVTESRPRYVVQLTADLTPIHAEPVESSEEGEIVAERLWRTFVVSPGIPFHQR